MKKYFLKLTLLFLIIGLILSAYGFHETHAKAVIEGDPYISAEYCGGILKTGESVDISFLYVYVDNWEGPNPDFENYKFYVVADDELEIGVNLETHKFNMAGTYLIKCTLEEFGLETTFNIYVQDEVTDYEVTFVYGEGKDDCIKKTVRESGTLLTPADEDFDVPEHKRFVYWLADHPGEGERTFVYNYDSIFYIERDLTFNALFVNDDEYVVSFLPTTGFGHMPYMVFSEGETCTLPECTFIAPDGCEFAAWENYFVFAESAQPGDTFEVETDDLIFYAYYVSESDPEPGDGPEGEIYLSLNYYNGQILKGEKLVFEELEVFITDGIYSDSDLTFYVDGKEVDIKNFVFNKTGEYCLKCECKKLHCSNEIMLEVVNKITEYNVKFYYGDGESDFIQKTVRSGGTVIAPDFLDFKLPKGKVLIYWLIDDPNDKDWGSYVSGSGYVTDIQRNLTYHVVLADDDSIIIYFNPYNAYGYMPFIEAKAGETIVLPEPTYRTEDRFIKFLGWKCIEIADDYIFPGAEIVVPECDLYFDAEYDYVYEIPQNNKANLIAFLIVGGASIVATAVGVVLYLNKNKTPKETKAKAPAKKAKKEE